MELKWIGGLIPLTPIRLRLSDLLGHDAKIGWSFYTPSRARDLMIKHREEFSETIGIDDSVFLDGS